MPQAAPAASEYRASLPAIWSALIVVYLIWGSTYSRSVMRSRPRRHFDGPPFASSSPEDFFALRRFKGDPRPKRWNGAVAAIIGIFLLVGGNGGVASGRTVWTIESRGALGAHRSALDGAHRYLSSRRQRPGSSRLPAFSSASMSSC